MQQMAWRRGGIASLAASSLALAACGGGGGTVRSTPPPPASTLPPPAPTPSPPPPSPPAPTPTPTPTPGTGFDTAEYRRSSGTSQHGAITAWAAGKTGAGQTIGIVDTGIDIGNSEFAGRISPASTDVTGTGRSIQQEDDHGTHVALVAAAARNGAGVMGVAYDAGLLVLRADQPGSCASGSTGDPEVRCGFQDSAIARGVDAAVANGARVINLSLGGKDGIGSTLREAVVRASAAGVVVVVAAGNGGDGSRAGVDPSRPSSFAEQVRAAGANNVIIVGSVDEGGQLSAFSQRAGGEAAWYLGARGERVCCVYRNGQPFVGQDANGAYNLLFSGTSFATPQVAGAAALLAQAFPNLTGQQIVRILLDSARDAGVSGVDPVYGAGVLDIAAAMAPRGTLTLAGSGIAVRAGADMATGSPAMGDALSTQSPVRGVALDSYARAYAVDLAPGMRGAAVAARLAPALFGTARTAMGGNDQLALAVTVANPELGGASVRPLLLPDAQADGARLIAARAIASLGPRTRVVLGLREAAGGAVDALALKRSPPFMVTAGGAADPGFANGGSAAIALRRAFGRFAVTAGLESGRVLQQDDTAAPGEPRADLPARTARFRVDYAQGGLDAGIGLALLQEDRSVLGASFAPMFGVTGADSWFVDAAAGVTFGNHWRIAGGWRQGFTRVRAGGLIADGPAMLSSGWHADLGHANILVTGDSIGLRVSQPLRVASGGIGLSLPVDYDYESGTITQGIQRVSLAPAGREIAGELAWRGPVLGGMASASVFYRREPGHYARLPDDRGVAFRWGRAF